MFLRFRPVNSADLAECVRCTRAGFAFPDDGDRDDLARLWRELLADGRMAGAVMEDAAAPQGARIVWHCFKTFPTDDYARALCAGELPPVPSRHLVDLRRRERPLPLLRLPEIRRANGDPGSGPGLTMLVLNYGSPFPMRADGGPGWDAILGKLLAFTEYFSSGYRVREVLEEFFGDYAVRLAANAGMTHRTDYARHYAGEAAATPPAPDRAVLMGLTAAEAREHVGTPFAALCQYEPPRFYFRPSEQEVLLYALLGDTDDEIAARLAVAPVTVRKRWDAAYARVNAAWPGFFRDNDEAARLGTPAKAAAPKAGGRGPEKKRHLLSYLRHHPEELRPLEARPQGGDRQGGAE